MARRIPIEWLELPVDTIDSIVNIIAMSCQIKSAKGACKSRQCMVDQTPRYENQVISRKSKIIRRDKRRKVKYL
jgi:hypothetical protein